MWRCVPATPLCSADQRTMASALRSWTPCSWSWRRSSHRPAAASEPWRSRDRWERAGKLPPSASRPLSVAICNSLCVLPFRSSQTGRTRRGISASWSWGKTQILPPLLATNQRSRSWTAKAATGRVQVPAGPNPKTCRLKSKSMNLQTIHKTFPALLKMMRPTGQQSQLCVTSHFSVK